MGFCMNTVTMQALNIVMKYPDFFIAPMEDQAAFQSWMKQSGMTTQVSNFSRALIGVLARKKPDYFDALVGNSLEADANCLKHGDFTRLITLFHENPNIAQKIVAHAKNPMFEKWREGHPESETILEARQSKLDSDIQKANVINEQKTSVMVKIGTLYPLMEEKSKQLKSQGYKQAATDANTFIIAITQTISRYRDNKIDMHQCLESCNMAILTAENSELQHHRGFFGKIFHALKLFLNNLTGGKVEITPTDSIETVQKYKSAISDLSEQFQDTQENESSDKDKLQSN
jgi:hypothetical protein